MKPVEIRWEPGKTIDKSDHVSLIAPLCDMCEAAATKERRSALDWNPICDDCSEWFAPNRIRTPESHDAQHSDDQH